MTSGLQCHSSPVQIVKLAIYSAILHYHEVCAFPSSKGYTVQLNPWESALYPPFLVVVEANPESLSSFIEGVWTVWLRESCFPVEQLVTWTRCAATYAGGDGATDYVSLLISEWDTGHTHEMNAYLDSRLAIVYSDQEFLVAIPLGSYHGVADGFAQ